MTKHLSPVTIKYDLDIQNTDILRDLEGMIIAAGTGKTKVSTKPRALCPTSETKTGKTWVLTYVLQSLRRSQCPRLLPIPL